MHEMTTVESLGSSVVSLPGNGLSLRRDDGYRKRILNSQGKKKFFLVSLRNGGKPPQHIFFFFLNYSMDKSKFVWTSSTHIR